MIEKAHENTGVWHTGEFSVKSAVPRAAISATVWTWSSGTGIRVYYTGANDLILEKANDGAWYDGAFRVSSASENGSPHVVGPEKLSYYTARLDVSYASLALNSPPYIHLRPQ